MVAQTSGMHGARTTRTPRITHFRKKKQDDERHSAGGNDLHGRIDEREEDGMGHGNDSWQWAGTVAGVVDRSCCTDLL